MVVAAVSGKGPQARNHAPGSYYFRKDVDRVRMPIQDGALAYFFLERRIPIQDTRQTEEACKNCSDQFVVREIEWRDVRRQ